MKRTLRVLGAAVGALILIFAVGVLWPVGPAPLAPVLADHVIDNVHIIDVRTGEAGAPTNLVIREGRISAIGSDRIDGLNRIDGRGGYLIPALWDMHSHSWQVSPQLHFPLYIANGVLAVRDMMDCPGEKDSLIACVRDKRRWSAEAEAGRMVAPRFVGVASFYFEKADLAPEQARSLARTYKKRGLDYLKTYNRLSPATYSALLDEARRQDIPVAGHLPKAVSLLDALQMGQRGFDHAHLLVRACSKHAADWAGGRLDHLAQAERDRLLLDSFDQSACERVIGEMARHDAWLVPTHLTRLDDVMAARDEQASDPRLQYLDPLSRWAYDDDASGTRGAYAGIEGRRLLERYFDHGLRLTGEAHRNGVRILAGTDTILGGFKLHDELELLVRAGLSPADALRSATLRPAEYSGREPDSGTIDPGKRADLILLRANPLEQIGNTRGIEAVFFGGRHYDRRQLDALLGYTRRQAGHPANWAKMVWGFAVSSVSGEL